MIVIIRLGLLVSDVGLVQFLCIFLAGGRLCIPFLDIVVLVACEVTLSVHDSLLDGRDLFQLLLPLLGVIQPSVGHLALQLGNVAFILRTLCLEVSLSLLECKIFFRKLLVVLLPVLEVQQRCGQVAQFLDHPRDSVAHADQHVVDNVSDGFEATHGLRQPSRRFLSRLHCRYYTCDDVNEQAKYGDNRCLAHRTECSGGVLDRVYHASSSTTHAAKSLHYLAFVVSDVTLKSSRGLFSLGDLCSELLYLELQLFSSRTFPFRFGKVIKLGGRLLQRRTHRHKTVLVALHLTDVVFQRCGVGLEDVLLLLHFDGCRCHCLVVFLFGHDASVQLVLIECLLLA